jgi:hypothetical protein
MRIFAQKPATRLRNSALINLKSWNNASFQQLPVTSGFGRSFNRVPVNTARETDPTQLAISEPGDPLEQEADRLADQVVQPGQPLAPSDHNDRPDAEGRRQAPTSQPSGSGNGLEAADQRFFEARFHHDFASVRVHADGEAGESARTLHARAYTLGSQVFFAPGQYRPGTTAGRRLLAHELSHVIQQDRMHSLEAGLIQRSPDDEKTGQKTLDQEGVTASDPVAKKTAGIIDAVFQRNKKLAPYIGDRLKKGLKIDEKGKFVKELSDGNFEDSYRKTNGLNSADPVPADFLGFYDYKKSEVHLRPGAEFGTAFHEAVHKLASPALYTTYLQVANNISNDLVEVLKEGVTALFADSMLNDEGLPDLIDAYRNKKKKAEKIEAGLGKDGFDVLAEFNFKGTNIGKIGELLGVSSQDFAKVGIKGVLQKMNQLI